MIDHTYLGAPVAKMSNKDLHECLSDGFTIHDDDGDPDAEFWIRLRLEVEMIRRTLGLRIRGE